MTRKRERALALLQRIKTPFSDPPAEEMPRISPRLRSVGEVLRERREELALDLDGIGEALRIKPAYLAALEQGRSHDLPGPTYAIGFVRAYAHYLGLDAEAILVRFKDEATGLTARPDLSLPVPLGERSLPGAAMLLVALILAMCGYGTWYYLSTGERSRPERVAPVPASLRSPSIVAGSPVPSTETTVAAETPAAPPATTGAPAATTAAPAAAPAAPAAAPAPPSTALVAGPAVAAPNPGASPVPATASPPAAPAARPAAAPAPPPAGPRVVIKALADCWIQVRAPDQTVVFSRVLKSGETYKVPEGPGLFLRTGNAGALEITVDGKPVPSIGGIGTLRRDVLLEPEALAAGTAIRG